MALQRRYSWQLLETSTCLVYVHKTLVLGYFSFFFLQSVPPGNSMRDHEAVINARGLECMNLNKARSRGNHYGSFMLAWFQLAECNAIDANSSHIYSA